MRTFIAPLLLGALLAACGPEEPRLDDPPPDTVPPVGEVAPGDEALLDDETRRSLADRIDEAALALQEHTRGMRVMPPREAHEAIEPHTERVEELASALAVALSATREAADDEAEAAAALGLQRGRHRALGQEISEIRAEMRAMDRLDENQRAEQLPGHFERLDRLTATAESVAAHLRRGHPAGGAARPG